MNGNFKLFFTALFITVLLAFSCQPRFTSEITVSELKQHIQYLSSEKLEGRATGSTGDSLAAVYIRKVLKRYGLVPAEGDGFQRFKVVASAEAGDGNFLSVNGTVFKIGEDFIPVSFSSNKSLTAEVVFAGYGFNISNDSININDYETVDASGKWIMVFRGDPEMDNPSSIFIPYSSDRHKTLLAKDKGAAGVLLVSGEEYDREDILETLTGGETECGIPVIRIKRYVADTILKSHGTSITSLEKLLKNPIVSKSFNTGTQVKATAEVIQHKATTRNVAMLLPGIDENLKNEYLVIGAHFDHLGWGGKGSSSRKPDTIAVHHGADDNASGTAMMMELAGRFAGEKANKRSILFIAFTGEEKGLLGSKYFTDHLPVDKEKINAMINLDMTGRLRETKDIQIGGVGTAAGLKEKAESLVDTLFLKPVFTSEGSGPSDHAAFYAKNIPVVFITTGAHPDYHTPEDTWDKINYNGMLTVSNYVFNLAKLLSSEPEKLTFMESGPTESISRRPIRRGVTLGIMPDVTGSVKNGLKVELVTSGRPADLGGMKKGDIITSINGEPVSDIEEYMYRLTRLKKGETITVVVLRDGRQLELLIQL